MPNALAPAFSDRSTAFELGNLRAYCVHAPGSPHARRCAAFDGHGREESMGTEPQVVVAVIAGILSLGLAVLVSGRAGPRPPEFWGFMKIRKRWWLGPIIMMLAMLALLVVLSRGGAGAALIYSLL